MRKLRYCVAHTLTGRYTWWNMWNIEQLKLHLKNNSNTSEKNTDYLDSLARCIEIFDYHKEEAYTVIERLDSSDLKFGLKFVLSTGGHLLNMNIRR